MDTQSQKKVIEAGFTIIRSDDYPQIRIKYKDEAHREWVTFDNFPTKASRDIAFNELLEQPNIIQD